VMEQFVVALNSVFPGAIIEMLNMEATQQIRYTLEDRFRYMKGRVKISDHVRVLTKESTSPTVGTLLKVMAVTETGGKFEIPADSRCFSCGEKGHWAKECPKKMTRKPWPERGEYRRYEDRDSRWRQRSISRERYPSQHMFKDKRE
jgi:hypothetical protein